MFPSTVDAIDDVSFGHYRLEQLSRSSAGSSRNRTAAKTRFPASGITIAFLLCSHSLLSSTLYSREYPSCMRCYFTITVRYHGEDVKLFSLIELTPCEIWASAPRKKPILSYFILSFNLSLFNVSEEVACSPV